MGPWIAGDINHDGKVGSQDLFTLAPAYGSQRGDENWDAHADINEDGLVDDEDLAIL